MLAMKSWKRRLRKWRNRVARRILSTRTGREMLVNAIVGILAGAFALAAIGVVHRLRRPKIA